jgi:hypothetical protein
LDAGCIVSNVIGLYSNVDESLGFISGVKVGQKQRDWLIKTLKAIKAERTKGTRKALIIAVHHPPFSAGGHGPSTAILKDNDDGAIKAASCLMQCLQPMLIITNVIRALFHSVVTSCKYLVSLQEAAGELPKV